MRKVIETTGATIDEAIDNALLQLGCSRDDEGVEIEVIARPKSGFLGFGKEPAKVRVSVEGTPAEGAAKFLEGLLVRLGTPAKIDIRENRAEKEIHMDLSGDNMGAVIGRRGETLDALQYLTTIVANRIEDDRWRVVLDTENYRAKRQETLIALANKTAARVVKYQKAVALEPMNPHERRIIHAALQSNEAVTTYSTGTEPNRKVIVALAGTEPKENAGQVKKSGSAPRRSGGHKRSRGRRPARSAE